MPDVVRPPVVSDDDSISLNSTLQSEPREEYPLERVLAERKKDGNKEYLVKWKDYPDERCTWEAEENFNNDNTIPEWERQKTLIRRGIEKPYNVEALELKVKRWIEETDRRKSRRRAKRLKAGLPVVFPTADENSEPMKRKVETSSDTEGDYMPLDSPTRVDRKPRRLKKRDFSSDIDTDSEDADIPLAHVSKSRNTKKASKTSSLVAKRGEESEHPVRPVARILENGGDTPTAEDNSSTDDSLMADLRKQATSESFPRPTRPQRDVASAVTEKPKPKATTRQMNADNSSVKTPPVPKPLARTLAENAKRISREVPKPKATLMGSKGRGPARFASKSAPSAKRGQVTGAAVLSNWASSLKPRKYYTGASAKGNVKVKPAENLSTRRRYEKAGRNEPPPNIEQLTFVNLKDGRPIENPSRKPSLGSAQTPKASFQHLHEDVVSPRIDLGPARMTSFTEAPQVDIKLPINMKSWDQSPRSLHTDDPRDSANISNDWPPQEPSSTVSLTLARFDDYRGEVSRVQPSDSPMPSRGWHSTQQYMPQGMALHQMVGDAGLKKLDRSPQYGGIEDVSDVFGSIVVGTNYEFVADVRFRGLPSVIKKLLLTVKIPPKQVHMWFKHICTAADYKSYFHDDRPSYYGAGHVVTWPNSEHFVDAMGNKLRMHDSGGLFFTPAFTMLVYPAGTESWRWIDDRYPNRPTITTTLRIVLRTPNPELYTIHSAPAQLISPPLIMEDETGTNALFRKVFGIEYAKLVPHTNNRNKAKHPDNVFLMYPVEDQEEHDVLVKYFEYNNAIVYTSQTPGAWDYFAGHLDAGVLLIHDSIIKLHQIPSLARIMRKPINIFNINLRPIPPDTCLTRLFPHGAALLLTDSLILNRPREVVRILTWFDTNILFNKPAGTWKLCLRPRFRSWILDIIQDRPPEDGRVYVETYALIYKIIPIELMDEDDDFETPKEDAPMACASSLGSFDPCVGLGPNSNDTVGIARNDALLVDWFAGWTRMKVEGMRRFNVVHGLGEEGAEVRKGWERKWSHLLPLSPDECLKLHSIAEWEVKEKSRLERKREEREKRMSISMGGA